MNYERSASSTVTLAAPAERVFALLDDPTALGVRMEMPSLMMLRVHEVGIERGERAEPSAPSSR
ncbi:MAG: hypothetical protein ACK4QP_02305 [Pseudorhizobium sp.]